jgi:hypothetical protein
MADKDWSQPQRGDVDFLSRWSRRKTEAEKNPPQTACNGEAPMTGNLSAAERDQLPCDADMPPIESLNEDSDYSAFLSPRVSEELRRQALRKLFRSPAFNVCDGLDDYADDFTSFAKLGDLVTSDMRHQMTRLADVLADDTSAEDHAQAEQATDETTATVASARGAPEARAETAHTPGAGEPRERG